MKKRISFAINLFHEGLICKQVILLAGERPLQPHLEKADGSVSNEAELLESLWVQMTSSQGLPPYLLVSTPMKHTDTGLQRPSTKGTLIQWMTSQPKPGRCLVISNQPFIPYQHIAILSTLPSSFDVETIGLSAENDTPISVYLDNIAKWIYEDYLLSSQVQDGL